MRIGTLTGGRIDDVVEPLAADPPCPHRRARAGQTPAPYGNELIRLVWNDRRVDGDPNRPAIRRRVPGDGDITAQTDEDRYSEHPVDSVGSAVSNQRLRSRPEVEAYTLRDRDAPSARVELHPVVPGDNSRRRGRPRVAMTDLREVSVVAECFQRVANRRVHGTEGLLGDALSGAEDLVQQRRDTRRLAAVPMDALFELRIGPKATGHAVHGIDLLSEDRRRSVESLGLPDSHRDTGPNGTKGPRQKALLRGGSVEETTHRDVPPEVTTGRVVVVVGGSVVVVGGASARGENEAPCEELTGLVGGTVVEVVVELALGDGSGLAVVAPECSLATTTPTTTEALVAAIITAKLTRLTRACARSRPAGEIGGRPWRRIEALGPELPAPLSRVFVISSRLPASAPVRP